MSIVLQRGMMTGDDKGKQPEESEWNCKAPEKVVGYDLERVKETFMEAKKSFNDASLPQEVRTSYLKKLTPP